MFGSQTKPFFNPSFDDCIPYVKINIIFVLGKIKTGIGTISLFVTVI